MTFGDRMKARRISLDKTQEDIAAIVKVTKQTIQKYENNIITNIPSDKIELIAMALDIAPCTLMGWDDKIIKDEFTKHEIEVIYSYRSHPEMQLSVDKLLGLEPDVFTAERLTAARKEKGGGTEKRTLSDSEREAIENGTFGEGF